MLSWFSDLWIGTILPSLFQKFPGLRNNLVVFWASSNFFLRTQNWERNKVTYGYTFILRFWVFVQRWCCYWEFNWIVGFVWTSFCGEKVMQSTDNFCEDRVGCCWHTILKQTPPAKRLSSLQNPYFHHSYGLTPYNLRSLCIFSILFSIHFLGSNRKNL